MVVHSNGIELYYEVVGTGEPLLWLHGFMGAGADWRHMFSRPPDGFQLIVPDLRGHGASSNPSGEFSFREAARDMIGLLDHLGLGRVKAIGVSGGGITLLHVATAAPSSLTSMVVVSAPPYFPAEARAFQRQASESMFDEVELGRMRERHRHGSAQLQELLRQGRALAEGYDDVNFTPPYLGTIAAETLLVFGDRDPLYPVSLAFELRSAIPRSHLWVVPNAGHAPVFADHAPRFVETALSFLRGGWSN
jgi:pimeloyl-ACP methyl ester carboxylesterase